MQQRAAALRIHLAIESLRDDYAGKTVISPYREERRGNAIQTDKSVTFGVRLQQFHSKLISLGAN